MRRRPLSSRRASRRGDPSREYLSVLLVSEYLPLRGGTVSQTMLHASELARAGHTPLVLTRHVAGTARREEIGGIRVERLGLAGQGVVAKAAALAATGAWLRRHRQSVAALNVMLDSDFAAVARAVGVPVVTMTWVGTGDAGRCLGGALRSLRRRLLADVQHIVLTPTMREELARFGYDATIIPVPLDPDRFQVADARLKRDARRRLGLGDEHIVLFVGHLKYGKGIDLLLEACRRLADTCGPIQLLLVGGPPSRTDRAYEAELRRTATTRELRGRVRFCGSSDDPRVYYQAADVFCLPSRREGMPNVLLEAMASGLPCVAPPSAGGHELLNDGLGVVPPSGSPADLAASIGALLASPVDARALGSAAAAAVREEYYSPRRIVSEYERVWASQRSLRGQPARSPRLGERSVPE